jgi:TetR/AcrR family transcriptional regulator
MPVSKSTTTDPDREARRQAEKAQRHSDRRLAIMRSAKELLVTQGIDRFTVAEVAQAARLSKPSLYYYFESKEALVAELAIETLSLELNALSGAVQKVGSGVEALVSLLRTRVDFFLDDVDAFRIVHVWAPALGLQTQLAQSNPSRQVTVLLSAIAQRLSTESTRRPGSDFQQLPLVAWALSQGILVRGIADAARPHDTAKCRTLRDAACRWLLDSLVE